MPLTLYYFLENLGSLAINGRRRGIRNPHIMAHIKSQKVQLPIAYRSDKAAFLFLAYRINYAKEQPDIKTWKEHLCAKAWGMMYSTSTHPSFLISPTIPNKCTPGPRSDQRGKRTWPHRNSPRRTPTTPKGDSEETKKASQL